MLIFPLNTETFKKSFLSGDGQIELHSDQDTWMTLIATGGKFLPTVTRVAGVNFKFMDALKFLSSLRSQQALALSLRSRRQSKARGFTLSRSTPGFTLSPAFAG